MTDRGSSMCKHGDTNPLGCKLCYPSPEHTYHDEFLRKSQELCLGLGYADSILEDKVAQALQEAHAAGRKAALPSRNDLEAWAKTYYEYSGFELPSPSEVYDYLSSRIEGEK